ncbi:MAG: tetratricopeptide repeat protein, partial [Cyclobacteriaceae bacterium]
GKPGQLNLFTRGKLVKLNQLSTFEEALILDEQGDKDAKVLYQRAIAEGDSVADAYCNLGILESESKNYSKAIDCFTLSLKEEPRHFESHYNLANLYAEIGNFPLAKVHYEISIEVEPDFPNSHFNLGLTLAMNKEIENAILSLMNYRKLAAREDKGHADELISTLTRTITN